MELLLNKELMKAFSKIIQRELTQALSTNKEEPQPQKKNKQRTLMMMKQLLKTKSKKQLSQVLPKQSPLEQNLTQKKKR